MNQATVDQAFAELHSLLGERATNEKPHRLPYSRDWSPRHRSHVDLPDMIVVPKTTDEVVEIVKIAYQHRLPVVPFAGGTGMGGGVAAWKGGIVIETKSLNQILELDQANMMATVQAGITIWDLNEALARHGLWFPHQPESKRACTIGASIGVDNDSTFGLRYGKILDVLSNVVLVTGEGKAVRIGRRKAAFTSSGYKLLDLIVGSEGTLGVVAEATVRVFPLPETRLVRGFVCRSLEDGIRALERILAAGLGIESAHLNCRQRLHFYTHAYREKYQREPDIPDWAEAILFLSFAGDSEVVDFSLAKATRILTDQFAAEGVKEQEMVDGWWASKHTLDFLPFRQKWPDSQRQKKFGAADVGLPIGKVEEAYQRFLEIAKRWDQDILGMTVYNESPNKPTASISFAVFTDDSTEESVANFYNYVREMSTMAVEMEGTMSSYIGDGDRLGGFNELEHGESYAYMKRIKEMFDPAGIFNPGKKFESRWIPRP
ncbi:MAG: FAD-binding oxidoreductase [Anaerolineae bacterium]|nr:FAD-binding oxidoreductase [Anaerolineae bacterium]